MKVALAFLLLWSPALAETPDFTLTSINIHNWPTAELFTFSVGGASFSHAFTPGTYDITPPPALLAKMQDGLDEMVRMQVGSNFIDRPASFYLLPATNREQTIDGVTRWQNSHYPSTGLGWTGFHLGRIFLALQTHDGHNSTYVEIHGGAPEPSNAGLLVMGGDAAFVVRRR